MLLYGYIPALITLVLMAAGMYLVFNILPSISGARTKPKGSHISLKPSDILYNLSRESAPVKGSRYTEPYESGEVARGSYNNFVRVQYYVIILLFILFDVDMALLLPWAFQFKTLGLIPFIETIIFILMPMTAVFYAFRKGYMRWIK
ncbi:MAG: NADH-quinone oxidoreductase subunit A [Candidatus Thermoplasmatota archaeon]|jgi:NADH-quinone oxidoreductase subunit A|nr:NADH-quinone oxidoreductase subunit A [Candidatus Thermoplasmatota archaeon]MCL5988636.1 NADH-quinone oxidoreductase subunit A [Candidatus Thermoplasmatota archaeon]